MMAGSLFAAGGGGEEALATDTTSGSRLEPATPTAGPASLYRKYRPQSFQADDIVGQDHIVRTLRNAIVLDRVAHAYLFSGPRGTGKTTTARLLAKAINCLDPDPAARPCNACANCLAINLGSCPDVIEIDAASNRGIDDIRDLRERVRYAPAQLSRKVYIIDEAHQITGAAANAFLKTLEEPPAHTHFILATTDPEELLPTIVSRCQRFEFRRIGVEDMVRRLHIVAEAEGAPVDPDALQAIARHATGSLRDALGLLEQLALQQGGPATNAAAVPIGVLDVQAALGLSRNERIESLVEALARADAGAALRIVQEAVDAGEDPRQLNRQLLGYLRQLLCARAGSGIDVDERVQALAGAFSLEQLAAHARRFSEIDFSIKHAPFPQLPLEVALVEAAEKPSISRTNEAPAAAMMAEERPATTREARPTSLRDRVRGAPTTVAPAPPPRMETVPPAAAPITPIRPEPVAATAAPGDFSVERVVELWPAIRADVKALNRRVEALLSEVDPVAIAGNHVTLAVPYPFHRDKLNADEVRETIAGVLSRQLARTVSISCVLRGELGQSAPASLAQPPSNGVTSAAPEDPATDENDERAAARIRAAKNIFDAEEIAPIGDGRAAGTLPGATG